MSTTYGEERKPRVGFFTDTSVCIGCKACEVACKEWNVIPEDGLVWTGESYDNTSALGANSWRHVAFVEQRKPLRLDGEASALDTPLTAPGAAPRANNSLTAPGAAPRADNSLTAPGAVSAEPLRWLMSSDVCKHCTHAACLDVCPTGALFRTEFGTVVVQEDVCNGCGYCVPACPFGVLDKRHLPRLDAARPAVERPVRASGPVEGVRGNREVPPTNRRKPKEDGRVWKCTLCYDRLKGGHEPACAKACPTDSIQFGELDELRERAEKRLAKLQAERWNGARLYGEDPDDGVGGFGAFFLLLDEPEVYGLPPDPVVTTKHLPQMWRTTAIAAAATVVGVALAFLGGRE